jgi:hypothetical protein
MLKKKARGTLPSRLGVKSAYWFQLLISIASLLIASLITVITVNRTNTRCVFIPIVVSDNTYICWCGVRVQVGVDVSLNWSVAIASSSKANYRQQYYA